MVLPQPFTTSSPAIASYNYTDIADGTGFILYYGMDVINATTHTYILSPNAKYSNTIETSSGYFNSTTTYQKALDIDFDLSAFKFAQTMEGNGIIELSVGNYQDGSSYNHYSYFVAKLRKWDGTTETDIISATTPTVTMPNNTKKSQSNTLPLTIPRTDFRAGDVLRLTIEGWCKLADGTSDSILIIAHDPQNEDGTQIIPTEQDARHTQLKLTIPFRLDL